MSRNFWMISTASVALAAVAAHAAPPPADFVIGNQAAATYESGGQTFTVQSNLVETTVNEIDGVTLTSDQTKTTAPGGNVYFPHTITNTGNASDSFTLAQDLAGGPLTDTFTPTGFVIYADADNDGQPDTLSPINSTPALGAGETFNFLVRALVPATTTAVDTADFTITATSDGGAAATNIDTITVSTDGIIDIQKDQTLATDADGDGMISVGDTVEVNLTYSNTGISPATNVQITDDLPIQNADGEAITLTYVTGSGRWSDSGATPMDDAAGAIDATNAQGTSIDYTFDGAALITATLDTVDAGRSGSVVFRYVVTAAQEGVFTNIATVQTTTQPPTSSNGSPISIAPVANVVLADALATAGTPGSGTDGTNLDGADASTSDTDGALNDSVGDSNDAFAGGTLAFDMVLTNLGTATDTLTLSVSNTDFPAGTTFQMVASDGVTPIVGNQVLLAPGASTHIQVLATLPITEAATAGGANFDAVVTATSSLDTTMHV